MKALSVLALGLISIVAIAQERPFHYNISETPQMVQGMNKAAALVGEAHGIYVKRTGMKSQKILVR